MLPGAEVSSKLSASRDVADEGLLQAPAANHRVYPASINRGAPGGFE